MKRMTILLPLITLIFILFAEETAAKPGNGRKGNRSDSSCTAVRKHRMFDELQLTEKQQYQLKSLHDEMTGVRENHHEAVKAVRDKIKNELLKKTPSRKTLNGYATELGKLHTGMTKDRTDHLLKVKEILTTEQFSKLVENEGQMRHKGFRGPGKQGGGCPHQNNCPHRSKGGYGRDCRRMDSGSTPPPPASENVEKTE